VRILISAGDLSGEIYGAEILKGLKNSFPTAEFFSLTNGLISKAGATPISSVSNVGVVGATEVLNELRKLYKLTEALFRFFSNTPPQAVILIDFPDMNLHIVARLAKRKGARVLYFIPPQAWAWRSSRVKLLKKLIDEVIVILPFEETFYKAHGLHKVFYFGHPILDKFQERQLSPGKDHPLTVGVFPGSRFSELQHHIPIINEVVKRLRLMYPQARFLLPIAPGIERELSNFEIASPIQLVSGSECQSATQIVLNQCHCALVASGTATLEVALMEMPMVVFYKVSSMTALIGKKVIKTPFVSLPNLIAGKAVVPEFIQYFEVEDIINAMKDLIEGIYEANKHPSWSRQKEALREIRGKLGKPPVMPRIVQHIEAFLKEVKI
jgi:lipid-A-disaccharide synthase